MFSLLKSTITRTLVSAAASVTVSGFYGCAYDESGITFTDFRFQVGQHAGSNATNCGISASTQSTLSQNICVASAFTNAQAAFAVYRTQGIDSSTAVALSVSKTGEVYKYSFDSDPTGSGSSSNGRITRRACLDPRLSGVVDASAFDVFYCEN